MSQSQYRSHQCTAVADSTGQRCKLRTARGRKCWHHTLRDDNLRIKKSGVKGAGLGLFSGKKRIKKGTSITRYTGEKVSRQEVKKRYPGKTTAQYTLCGSKTKCRDARRTDESGLGRWANDSRGTKKRNNAKLTSAYTVKSTRTIPPDTEIFASYGRGYWK
jgi:hypothetical protein